MFLMSNQWAQGFRAVLAGLTFFLAPLAPQCGQPAGDATVTTGTGTLFRPLARRDLHDGYLVGNGRMIAVAALGQEITREGKSFLSPTTTSLTRIASINGPSYGNANLGFGWEVGAQIDRRPLAWTRERITRPTPERPFWGVASESGELLCQLTDVMDSEEPVLLRQLEITRPQGLPAAAVKLSLPVWPDPRNGRYVDFSGQPVAPSDPLWQPSVPPGEMLRIDRAAGAIVLKAAPRRLYKEISTPYAMEFPARILATAASGQGGSVRTGIDGQGLSVDLGVMKGGERRTAAVWIVTAATEREALARLKDWRAKDPAKVIRACIRQQPRPLLARTDGRPDGLLDTIGSCLDLIHAGQGRCGGVLAQAYMYPMCYIRDQYGSFRLFLDSGEAERAYKILAFDVAMENQYGIQNAHDAIPEPPDPTRFDPASGRKDSYQNQAEVPSIVILMARDYYRATGDLERIGRLYPRLAYNLRVQRPGRNGLLPTVGDESYTNVAAPRFTAEMTDSNLLFIAAADFMAQLAERLGKPGDASEFRSRGGKVRAALMQRLWLPGERRFAFGRDESNDEGKIDRRPAFDLLLRWFWLELSDPLDPLPQDCLAAVLKELCHPIQVVPQGGICAGMDPGYLLYALARSQHPATPEAARLLLDYASETGVFNEYYLYPEGRIAPDPWGGKMRFWESAINGWALIHYLMGLRLDMPGGQIYLQPHLPSDWPGWESREVALPGEGTIQMRLERSGRGRIVLDLTRRGGNQPLKVNVEFGAFGPRLIPAGDALKPVAGRPDLLRAALTLPPGGRGLFGGAAKCRLAFLTADSNE